MRIFLIVAFGTPLFWVLISAAFAAAALFIFGIIRRLRSNKKLDDPIPDSQKKIIYTAAQIEVLQEMLADTGYAFDYQQNIFYSVLNPWQRKLGYCSLYDESAPALGMVIDCEPVYFEYGGKHWMIELWKGQYGITTGAEIGIYNTTGPELDIPGVFNGTFYNCAENEENLSMTYTLLKEGRVLFSRAARHWWLTGFVLGEYTRPSALIMEASITFRDIAMKDAFVSGLRHIGYHDSEIRSSGSTVLVVFSKPRSKQPLTRHGLISFIAMKSDKSLVRKYRRLTKGLDNMADILTALKEKSGPIYELATNIGRRKELLKKRELIDQYLK